MIKQILFSLLLLGCSFISQSQQQLSFIQHRTGASSNPRAFQKLGAKLLFIADTQEYGAEWWTTDGTDAGTKLLKDIAPGPASNLVRVLNNSFMPEVEQSIQVANGLMYFLTKNALNQSELWQTDGTTEGTQLIYTYEGVIEQFKPTLQRDKFYIIENFGLYYVDITAKTKRRVSNPGGSVTFVLPDHVLNTDAPVLLEYQLFFTYNVQGEYELWRTDGSASGTQRLFAQLFRIGQPLYNVYKGDVYVYNSHNDKVVIKTRGTPATTQVLIPPVTTLPSQTPERFRGMTSRIVGNEFQLIEYPQLHNSSGSQVLLRTTSDGQALRTVFEKTLPIGVASRIQVLENKLYYAVQTKIIGLDLTTGDTTNTPVGWSVGGVEYLSVKKLSTNSLAYHLISSDSRSQLYLFDASARRVSTMNSYVSEVNELNNSLVLSGSTTAKGNVNLYKSALTGADVKALGNLYQTGDNEIPQFVLKNQLYFIADNEGQGIALYKTDGLTGSQPVKVLTTSQTALLNGAGSGLVYSDGQRALFSYTDLNRNRSFWVTDGTAGGTVVLANFVNADFIPVAYTSGQQLEVWLGGTRFYKVDLAGPTMVQSAGTINVSGDRKTQLAENKILVYDTQSLAVVGFDNAINNLENRTLFTIDSTVVPLSIGARFFYLRRKTSGKVGVMSSAAVTDTPRELIELPSAKSTFKTSDAYFVHRSEANTNGQIVSFLTFVDADAQRVQEMGPFEFSELRGVQKIGNSYALAVVTGTNRLNVAMLDVTAKSIRLLKGDAAADARSRFVVNGQDVFVIGGNVWKVLPAKDSLSRLLPAKFYQNGRTFAQDKKLYLSYADPSPETWEIDSVKAQQLGNFFVTTRFTELLEKKSFQGYIKNSTGPANGIYIVESPTQAVLLKALPANRIVPEQPFAGMLIFAAENEATGNELWITEGTLERTRQLADLRTGVQSSNPKDFKVMGNSVTCSAFVGTQGRQLWNVTPPVLAVKMPIPTFSLNVFPNPVRETLSVRITGAEKAAMYLKIIDISGRIVAEKLLASTEQTEEMDVSHLSTGTYIVSVSNGYRWASQKIYKY
ncbi:T9SS type A sorting domain-containing protein [Runella sp.]|uniref:T9SS type A sorting domain-containing protein n=1 Tax=Runella sp. TaxID=1960881 RepID=UPI003D0C6A51